jgi:hypothetical protein
MGARDELLALEGLSLGDCWLGWTIVFTLGLGTIGVFLAPNDLRSIATYLATACGMAPFFGALLGVPMWVVIRLAS